MIDVNKIIKTVESKSDGRKVQSIIDYDDTAYVAIAFPKGLSDYNNVFAINKRDGKAYIFNISGDFKKFSEAAKNRTIYEAKE